MGDSHAEAIGRLCDELATENGLSGAELGRPGFVPLLNTWQSDPQIDGPAIQIQWNKDVVNWIVKHNVREVLIVARWEDRLGALNQERMDALLRDRTSSQASPSDAERVASVRFGETIKLLRAARCRLWIISQVPVRKSESLDFEPEDSGVVRSLPSGVTRAEYTIQQLPCERVFGRFEGDDVVIVREDGHWFDEEDRSCIFDRRERLYDDDNHVSVYGAESLLKPILSPVSVSIGRAHEQRKRRRLLE